jgi:hypothetical protein
MQDGIAILPPYPAWPLSCVLPPLLLLLLLLLQI